MTDILLNDGVWTVGDIHKFIVSSDDGDTINYSLAEVGTSWVSANYGIKYVRSIQTWSDGAAAGASTTPPHTFNSSNDFSTSVLFVVNPAYLYGFDAGGSLVFSFQNDHYEAPPPPNTNSVSDVFVSYVVEDNELRVYIPLDKPSTVHPNPDPAGRDLYYQLRKVSGTSFFQRIVHTQGTATNETIVPTTAGIYQLEKVQTNPTSYTTYDTAEVSQAQLDFYATNNPPDDDPPDDDPPENDPPPTPVFVPRSARRGNLNFW